MANFRIDELAVSVFLAKRWRRSIVFRTRIERQRAKWELSRTHVPAQDFESVAATARLCLFGKILESTVFSFAILLFLWKYKSQELVIYKLPDLWE